MSFQVLFQQNCSGCHGADGKLGPAPPLNDPLFLALVPDTELERVITEGRPGTLMPAFSIVKGGQLTTEQVKVLAQGIKPHWGPVQPAPSGAPPYLAMPSTPSSQKNKIESLTFAPSPEKGAANGGKATLKNSDDGLKVFMRACAGCHGDYGQGGQYSGEPNGRPVGAINDPNFLALISNQALRRFVITGRPDLGMPDYAEPKGRPENFKPLTSQEVTAIVSLLASWRQGRSVQGD